MKVRHPSVEAKSFTACARHRALGALVIVLSVTLTVACAHQQTGQGDQRSPACLSSNEGSPPCLTEQLAGGGISREALRCNSNNAWGDDLRGDAKLAASQLMTVLEGSLAESEPAAREELANELTDFMMWWIVRGILIQGENNNLGGLVLRDRFWTDENGRSHPLTVFRAAFTPDPLAESSCYRSLLTAGRVRHVVNLYDGAMHVADLVQAERDVAGQLGASHVTTAELDYGHWRDALREHPEDGPEREAALEALGGLIKEQILEPGGSPPRGNILIHCGGGMHRTGMVMGILRHHLNGEPIQDVASYYGYHVDHHGPDDPGGFEQDNLDVIRDFDPELLK